MLLTADNDSNELTAEFSKGALVWYNFKSNSHIMYIYNNIPDDGVIDFLKSKGCVDTFHVGEDLLNKSDIDCSVKYDYIVGIDILEECREVKRLLGICKLLLKPDGRLIIGAENRFAIKYFCGDRDPYTNHSFDGIEHYRRITKQDENDIKGRCYSKKELYDMLASNGFGYNKFYSVMPDLKEAQLIYADGYKPVEELAMRYFPLYNYPESVFLEEEYLYTDLIKNDMFHIMANAFLIECSMDNSFDSTLHATISLDRGKENALVTGIIEQDGVKSVYKKAVYPDGVKKLKELKYNLNNLKDNGINVVESDIKNDTFIMPYIDKPIAMNKLKEVAKKDKNEFFKALDAMYELILASSDHNGILSEKDKNSANGRDMGAILSKGYIDMVPLNCFYDESASNPKDRFIYYDQEFYYENCPAKAVLYRSISIIYDGTDKEFQQLIPMTEVLERYGLCECKDIYARMSSRFTDTLRNQKALEPFYRTRRCDKRNIYTNREMINYSAKDYRRIFIDIFDDLDNKADNKKLILFGSGLFTRRFLNTFSGDYNIYCIIDNNKDKWNTEIDGIPVKSPDILNDIPENQRHIIICIKKYYGVANQLKDMGITDYHIYDPANDYPNKRREAVLKRIADSNKKFAYDDNISGKNITDTFSDDTSDTHNNADTSKQYNVGYIAGVFDLFHIGHLNMFKRAKEQCNYLIVGVVSDEGVRLNKQAEPYVPFEERIEMVRACKYVDEAVKLPLDFAGTRDMFKIYHFDVQFSGSDYENDPAWLTEKEWLENNGSTMVFFPYTKSTSSTKLKKAIEVRTK